MEKIKVHHTVDHDPKQKVSLDDRKISAVLDLSMTISKVLLGYGFKNTVCEFRVQQVDLRRLEYFMGALWSISSVRTCTLNLYPPLNRCYSALVIWRHENLSSTK